MKRFLIYLFVFPTVATLAFYAVVFLLTGAAVDSLMGPALIYGIAIIPGLVIAVVDMLFAKSPVTAVIAGTALVYGASVVLLFMEGEAHGIVIVALALIPAVPTAVSSWLTNKRLPAPADVGQAA